MRLEQRAHLRIEGAQLQTIMMSGEMQLALHMLTLPHDELEEVVQDELEKNILVEEVYSHKESESYEPDDTLQKKKEYSLSLLTYKKSLKTEWEEEIESLFSEEEKKVAYYIINSLDAHGLFKETKIPFEPALFEKVLQKVQTLDPPGVAARSIQESLLIKLKRGGLKHDVLFQIVSHSFKEIEKKEWGKIQKKHHLTEHEWEEKFSALKKLHLYPTFLEEEFSIPIKPDLFLEIEHNTPHIRLEEVDFPSFRLSERHLKLWKEGTAEEKEYFFKRYSSLRWLFKALHQRNETLLKIAVKLVEKQKEFFLSQGDLRPLNMISLSEELEMSESTISRATLNTYLQTPTGIYPLRYFFSSGIEETSSKTIQNMIKQLIEKEDKKKPLSDEMLMRKLQEKNIPVKRRTVTKYRLQLGFSNSSKRSN